MRCQRDLEIPPERGSVQRGDDRFRRVLDQIEHGGNMGRRRRLAEFGDVGAGDEGAPRTDDDDRLDRAVRHGGLDAALQAVANRLRQRVDRRRVDRDGRDVAVDRQFGDGIDRGHRVPPVWRDGLRRALKTRGAGACLEQPPPPGQLPATQGICSRSRFPTGRRRVRAPNKCCRGGVTKRPWAAKKDRNRFRPRREP